MTVRYNHLAAIIFACLAFAFLNVTPARAGGETVGPPNAFIGW